MATQPDAATPPAGPNVTRIALFGLLLLSIATLVYDKSVAIPAMKKAFDAVEVKNNEINASADRRAMSNEDVQAVLGAKPTAVETEGKYTIERYNLSAVPIFPRNYFAVYTSNDDGKLTFKSHGLKREELDLTPPPQVPVPSATAGGATASGAPAEATAAPTGDAAPAATEAPAAQTPAGEAPSTESPAAETPAAGQAPAGE